MAAGRIGDGHRIRVIAPSGAHLSLEQFDRARAWFTERGHEIRCDVPRIPWQRFSATDDERLAAIHAAAREDGLDAVMVVRGGYGLSRLLDRIDWQLVAQSAQRGVRWVGYSDFTAFQLAMLAAGGAHSIAGPSFSWDFGRPEQPDAYTAASLEAALSHQPAEIAWPAGDQPNPVPPDEGLRGTLWGGNLTMVAGLAGTPYLPRIDGGLLFIEDVAEHPYRIERMLHQLHYAGVLARQRAIILGAFTDWRSSGHDNGYDFDAMVAYWRARIGIPIVTGLPFGHVERKASLELGRDYRLASAGDSLVLAAC